MLIPALYNYLDVTPDDIAGIKASGDKKFLEAINKIINIYLIGHSIGYPGVNSQPLTEKATF